MFWSWSKIRTPPRPLVILCSVLFVLYGASVALSATEVRKATGRKW